MIPPEDRKPGEPTPPRRRDDDGPPPGEPPGMRAQRERLKAQREAEELERLQRELEEVENFRMPLMEHLVELKDRLVWSLVAVTLTTAVCFYFAAEIIDFLVAPFNEAIAKNPNVEGGTTLNQTPFEGIYSYLKVSLLAGFAVASPVVSYQVWMFIAPGLYRTERKAVIPLAFSSVVLFLAGASFCYFGIFPYAFPFFIDVLELDINLSIEGYLSSVMRMMVAFGLCFQLPVGAWFLARIGLIDHIDMAHGFRYAVVIIFILAALITPPDPLTQVLLGIPMMLLYAIGIGIAWLATTKERDEETEAAAG